MKKRTKWVFGGTAGALVACALLINPPLTNPPVQPGSDLTASNPPPAEIVKILHGACYDCHSDETKWPWYSHVAPVSWWLVEHVNDGRKHLDFSKWPHDDPHRAGRNWGRISDSVSSGDMPFPNYDLMHPAAKLTDAQRDQLANWADQEADRLRAIAAEQDSE